MAIENYLRSQGTDGSVRSRTVSISSVVSLESGDLDRKIIHKNQVNSTNDEGTSQPNDNARLTEEEEALAGNVRWSIYLKYFKSFGWITWIISVLLLFICQALIIGTNVVLAVWTDDPHKDDVDVRNWFLSIEFIVFYS